MQVVINVSNESNLVSHCQEVARLIDEGYYSGMIGEDGDSWYIEKD